MTTDKKIIADYIILDCNNDYYTEIMIIIYLCVCVCVCVTTYTLSVEIPRT